MKVVVAMKVADLSQEHLEWCTEVLVWWVSNWRPKDVAKKEKSIKRLVSSFKHLVVPSKVPLYRQLWITTKSFNALLKGGKVPLKKRVFISTTSNPKLQLETNYSTNGATTSIMVRLPEQAIGLDVYSFEKLCAKRVAELKVEVKKDPMLTDTRRNFELEMLSDLAHTLADFIPEEKEWIVPGSYLTSVSKKDVIGWKYHNHANWQPLANAGKKNPPKSVEDPRKGQLSKVQRKWSTPKVTALAKKYAPTSIKGEAVIRKEIAPNTVAIYSKKGGKRLGYWVPA